MSEPAGGERDFNFLEITLLKDQALGRGSYGSVCKAKCDTLTCAAKIMHSVFFSQEDPGERSMMKRFNQECQILSAIKHPNIVQYLGTITDVDTNMPVLLMELMDQNLTHYLKTCSEPLPFYRQVNFGLDIAQALAYLHSNGIQHRDLSSNNILLLGELRAKVTDFGMSRLEKVNSRMTPVTTCPGTVVYMPPEALKESPQYTDKIDIFSFGVLLIQILTRQFPDPSTRFTYFQVPDPSNQKKMIEVQSLVKEIDRRQTHIAMVKKTQKPLLNISLECLKDNFEERPSATELCKLLEEKKATKAYGQSSEVVDYKSMYHRLLDEFDLLRGIHDKVKTDCNIHLKKISLFEQLLKDKDSVIQEREGIIEAQWAKIQDGFSLHWKHSKSPPVNFKFNGRGHTAVVGKMAYFHELDKKSIYQFDTIKEVWETLPEPPIGTDFTIIAIQNMLTTIGGLGNTEGNLYIHKLITHEGWVQHFPPMGSSWIKPFAITIQNKVMVMGRSIEMNNTGMVLDLKTSQWTQFETYFSPTFFHSAFIFTTNNTLYHAGGYDYDGPTTKFYSCPLSEFWNPTAWTQLRNQPLLQQTTACIRGRILGLGCVASGHLSSIYKYNVEDNCWEKVGKLDIAKSNCMAAVVEDKMIVVGGDTSQDTTPITHIATIDTTTIIP